MYEVDTKGKLILMMIIFNRSLVIDLKHKTSKNDAEI